MKKSFLLVLAFMLCLIPFPFKNSLADSSDGHDAASLSYAGSCGPHLTWSINSDIMTISGTGPMINYSNWYDTPWNYNKTFTSLIVEEGVTSIGNNAFALCSVLRSVSLPNSLKVIGEHAFRNCTSLESITIPDNVRTVGPNAFSNCTSLSSVKLPSSITEIDQYTFSGCGCLEHITIPWGVQKIKYAAFRNCGVLSYIKIPSSLEMVDVDAFENCYFLEDVYFDGTREEYQINTYGGNDYFINARWHFLESNTPAPTEVPTPEPTATPEPSPTPKPTPAPFSDDSVNINGASLTLEGQITINFFLQVPEDSTANTVSLEYAKGETKAYSLDKSSRYYDSITREYKLSYPNIPAKEMTVPVTLKVFDANGYQLSLEHYKLGSLENHEYAYCVADWARNIISGTGKKAETVYLAKALLNYGDYAQKYFAYNTNNPANPNGYLASEMGGVSAVAANDAVIPADAKEKIGYSGASLILEGATSVRLYFTQEVAARNANGNGYYLHQSGKEWYVEIPNIASKDLDQKYVVIVTKDGVDYRFEYSALSYANGRLANAKAKTDIKNLCKALYLYNAAANVYFK